MTNVLSIEHVQVSFDKTKVLSDINFSLPSGEILGLLGASGCGKTTLLNTIAGFIHQSNGDITIDGVGTITPNSFIEPEKRHVGMIFQDYALFPHLTLEENVAFGLGKLSEKEKAHQIKHLLSVLKLEGLNKQYPHQLSGGQQQRVAIARALAPKPRLLLLDEPFSNIDARLRHDLIHELREALKSLSMSAIFVTHNKDEVFAFADKVAVMHQGKIMQFGKPAVVCDQPDNFHVADFLQLGSFVPVLYQDSEKLVTPLGELSPSDTKIVDKDDVTLVKASHFRVSSNQQTNGRIMQVTVTELGFKLRIEVSVEEHIFEITAFSDEVFQVGDSVAVSMEHHKAIVLPV